MAPRNLLRPGHKPLSGCVYLPIFPLRDTCQDHPAIRIARISGGAPRDWHARKAGDCFGFSPPFT